MIQFNKRVNSNLQLDFYSNFEDITEKNIILKDNDFYLINPEVKLKLEAAIEIWQEGLDSILELFVEKDANFNEVLKAVEVARSTKKTCSDIYKELRHVFYLFRDGDLGRCDFIKYAPDLTLPGALKYGHTQLYAQAYCAAVSIGSAKGFLRHYEKLPSDVIQKGEFLFEYNRQIDNLVDHYSWYRMKEVETGVSESAVETFGAGYSAPIFKISLSDKAIKRLAPLKINYGGLISNNKRCLIADIAPVEDSEIAKAAKKIKTVSDISAFNVYKITAGCRILKMRPLLHREFYSEEEFRTLVEDIKGYYLITTVIDGKTHTAIASSLGRTIASVSKTLQDRVMDSLNLDDFSF